MDKNIMTNEEKIIQERLGTKNPFRVPEDYFEHFADQLMEKLPEREVPAVLDGSPVETSASAKEVQMKSNTKRSTLRIFLAAACLCVAIFSISLYFSRTQQSAEQEPVAAVANTTNIDDEYMDEAADYVMLDNADIYACLSE